MKKLKNIFVLVLTCTILCILSGCKTQIELALQKDGTILVKMDLNAGNAFTQMFVAAGGEGNQLFETKEVTQEFEKAGFSQVKVSAENADLHVSMVDNGNTFLSDFVQKDKNDIVVVINPKNLMEYYSKADEQTVMLLDLLLAPVFNDEVMSEEEYVILVSSLYGENIGNELAESVVQVTIVSGEGKKTSNDVKLTKLLCLSEEFVLHSSN